MSMPHQYGQQQFDQIHMSQRQVITNPAPAFPPAPLQGPYGQPMHIPGGQPIVAPQQKPMVSATNLQTMSIRAYLDQTVVPVLVDGKDIINVSHEDK
jgi:hypothetical protein